MRVRTGESDTGRCPLADADGCTRWERPALRGHRPDGVVEPPGVVAARQPVAPGSRLGAPPGRQVIGARDLVEDDGLVPHDRTDDRAPVGTERVEETVEVVERQPAGRVRPAGLLRRDHHGSWSVLAKRSSSCVRVAVEAP